MLLMNIVAAPLRMNCFLLLFLVVNATVYAAEPAHSLDDWIDNTLAPKLIEQITSQPRFQNKHFLLLGMSQGKVLSEIDGLRRHVRQRLTNRLLDVAEIKLLNHAAQPTQHQRKKTDLACFNDADADYYLGIDVQPSSRDGIMSMSIRAVEPGAEHQWVSGFGASFDWLLSAEQTEFLSQKRVDDGIRGLRALPFKGNEPELLAQYLARNLSCLMRADLSKDIRLMVQPPRTSNETLSSSFNLLTHYLAGIDEVLMFTELKQANFLVKLRVESLDSQAQLMLVSAHVEDKSSGEVLRGVATRSYIDLKSEHLPPLFTEFGIEVPSEAHECSEADPLLGAKQWLGAKTLLVSEQCFSIGYKTRRPADVFIVHQDHDGQLLQWQPNQCIELQGTPLDTRANQKVRFPARDSIAKVLFLDDHIGPDTIYLIAAEDVKAKSLVKQVIDPINMVCERHSSEMPLPSVSFEATLEQLAADHSSIHWQRLLINHQ